MFMSMNKSAHLESSREREKKLHQIFLQAARMEAAKSFQMELMEGVNNGEVRYQNLSLIVLISPEPQLTLCK